MRKIEKLIYQFETWIAGVTLVAILIAPMLDVVERNLKVSLIGLGTEMQEIVIYMFIYLSYVGISIAVRTRAHIRTTLLLGLLPAKIREGIELSCKLLFLSFCMFMLFESGRLLSYSFRMGEKTPSLGIPIYFILLALPLGFVLSSFHLIVMIYEKKDLG